MCAKRLAEELNEGFIEDYSTPSKKPRTEQLDTPSRRQKNSYTLEFKLKLVEEAKKLSIAAISKRHSIDRMSICCMLKVKNVNFFLDETKSFFMAKLNENSVT